MRRVLVLGSSYSAIEMIKCVKNLGFVVTVCGGDPSEPGHAIGDESLFVDYSDAEAVSKYVRSNRTDYVLPTSNDVAYRTGLELAQIFKFPGFDSLQNGLNFLEKNKFRELCARLDLAIPDFKVCTPDKLISVQSKFELPFLVKPTDGFSGKGILKILNEADRIELGRLEQDKTSKKSFVIEKYLTGTLHSHSAFVKSGVIVSDFFVDEYCILNEFAVDSSNHPSNLGQLIKSQVQEMISRILDYSNLVDGLIHTQFMISNKKPYLIESMRRCPGDLYPNLIKLSTGFDYIYNYVAPFLQLPIEDSRSVSRESLPIARFTVASREPVRAYAINVPEECVGFSFYPLLKSGDHLNAYPGEKAGVLFMQLPTLDDLVSLVPYAQQRIGVLD